MSRSWLGVDDAEERERARRRWRSQIEDAQGALDILTGSAPQDLEDELDPEILMAYDLIDASQLAERQNVGTRLTTAERAAGDRTWTYGHVIVDEAQELSAMAWRMVMRRIPNRWVTVVGDVAQTSDPAGASSWQRMLEPYVAQRWKLAQLSVNYRTPSEIMAVAAAVLAEAGVVDSIGSTGDSYDNALAESINGLYKTELIKRAKPWKGADDVEIATAEWVDWFNHRRLYEYCGDIPPVELEEAYYARKTAQQTAALTV